MTANHNTLLIIAISALAAWLMLLLEVYDEKQLERFSTMISRYNPPVSRQTLVPGWHTEGEADLLISLARRVPQDGLIVELGGEWGRSASEFLFATNDHSNVQVYTIDLFPDNYQDTGLNLMDILKRNLNEWTDNAPYKVDISRHSCWKHDSTLGLPVQWSSWDIDLLFIDATHTYDAVKAEIAGWLPHVCVGGHVAFHDYAGATNSNPHPTHHDVARAVDEWYGANKDNWLKVHELDSTIVFKRVNRDKKLLDDYDAYDVPLEHDGVEVEYELSEIDGVEIEIEHIEVEGTYADDTYVALRDGDVVGSVTTNGDSDTVESIDYDSMTRDELADLATERGLFVGNSKKKTLIKKLKDYDSESKQE